MRIERFEWNGAGATATAIRDWAVAGAAPAEVAKIEAAVRQEGDRAVMRMNRRFDSTEIEPPALRVQPEGAVIAFEALDPAVRDSLELAAENVRAVAEAALDSEPRRVALPQGQSVSLREVPVAAAGIYAPGGRAAYPSSVLMCAIPARVAGVERLALASPPRTDGTLNPLVLAAAELCQVDEIYAMGGAQAIFALAYGTESVAAVDVIAGPGSNWVREAKRAVCGQVGIDSLAGPSELMVVAGRDVDPAWAALDLCAQAEHGGEGPLVVVAVDGTVLDAVGRATDRAAAERPGVEAARLALVRVPGLGEAIDLANAFAPEHLELLDEEAASRAAEVTSAGCVFTGPYAATAFGDYVAGSNHVLPTGGAGRFSGPLGPDVFRRKIATVEVPADAAAKLAPHAKVLAEAEGFPVHGESAMIRAEDD